MNAWPEAAAVERFLARVRRRLALLRAIEGAALGLWMVALLVLTGTRSTTVLAAVVVSLALVRVVFGDRWRFGWWRSLPRIAEQLERRTPVPRNLVVTASELMGRARGYVHDAVMARAAGLVKDLDLPLLFPARKALIALASGVAVLAASLARPDVGRRAVGALPFRADGPAVRRVEITVVPPVYSGLPRSTSTNPSRIEALAASRIEIRVEATGASVEVETLAGTQPMALANGVYTTNLIAASDGFIAMEPRDSAGRAGQRQLIGLSVTPDRAPRVTLTSPGRDLFFTTVPDTLPVVISADDDLALASVSLKYTAVSGSGERFTFTEREVPVTVGASSPRTWAARGAWRIGQLGLTPGDMVVYRAVATDRRPGAKPVESESYVLEVVTPGAIAAEGFAADDHRDRYAVSQQMVILKTERLIARRAALNADSLSDESRLLAAEQRQVRAEFVFMMGGELEDVAGEAAGTLELNEVAEAEAEGDLLAGRMQNQGRVDMMRAIRAMSRASTALTAASLDQALRDERAALDDLMRAFARSRFILRALTQRERIDLDRRLSGALNLTAGLSGPASEPAPGARTIALRRLLADVASFSSGGPTTLDATALALLRADPGSDTLRRIASRVQALARATRPADLRLVIDSIVDQVSSLLAASLPVSPRNGELLEAGLLQGALRDASRRP